MYRKGTSDSVAFWPTMRGLQLIKHCKPRSHHWHEEKEGTPWWQKTSGKQEKTTRGESDELEEQSDELGRESWKSDHSESDQSDEDSDD